MLANASGDLDCVIVIRELLSKWTWLKYYQGAHTNIEELTQLGVLDME